MDERNAIETLRTALAAIWTEGEKDNPCIEDMQKIATEALDATLIFAKHKVPSDLVGYDSWKVFFDRVHAEYEGFPQWKKDFLRQNSEEFNENMKKLNIDD